jgi:hypothetical protein
MPDAGEAAERVAGAWDYYKVLKTIPGEAAWVSKSETKCTAWK